MAPIIITAPAQDICKLHVEVVIKDLSWKSVTKYKSVLQVIIITIEFNHAQCISQCYMVAVVGR